MSANVTAEERIGQGMIDVLGGKEPAPLPAPAERAERRLAMFCVHLAGGVSIAEAARLMKVSERTARRWASRQDVKQRVETLRSDLLRTAQAGLEALFADAPKVLRELLGDGQPAEVRLRALSMLFERFPLPKDPGPAPSLTIWQVLGLSGPVGPKA